MTSADRHPELWQHRSDSRRIRSQSLFTNRKEHLDGGCKCLEIAEMVSCSGSHVGVFLVGLSCVHTPVLSR